MIIDEIKRSANDSATFVQQGLIAFQNGEYKKCLQILNSDSVQDKLNTHLFLIEGLSYLETGDFNNAELFITKAVDDKNNAYHDDCLWYLSLLYVKTDKPQSAIPALKELIKNNSVYVKEAKEILNTIE